MLINLCLNVIGNDKFGVELHKRRTPKCYKFYLSHRSVLVNEKTTSSSKQKVCIICLVVSANMVLYWLHFIFKIDRY